MAQPDAVVGNPSARSPGWRRVLRVVAGFITLAACVFLVREGRAVFGSGVLAGFHILAPWAVLSVLVALIHLAIFACLFSAFLSVGDRTRAGWIFMASQGAKYVPGKVWGVVLQRYLIGENAGPWSEILRANVLMMVILSITQITSSAMAWLALSTGVGLAALLAVVAALGVWAGVELCGRILQRIERMGLFGRWLSRQAGMSGLGVLLGSVTISLAWWTLYAGALSQRPDESLALVAASSISVVAGFASVLPGGLGVREAVFMWLADIQMTVPPGKLAALAVLSRAWLLIVDVVAVLVATLALGVGGIRGRKDAK